MADTLLKPCRKHKTVKMGTVGWPQCMDCMCYVEFDRGKNKWVTVGTVKKKMGTGK